MQDFSLTDKLLSSLNKEQQQAVLDTEGPLLVIAGAGSGKTRVLTHRIAYLIMEKHIEPSRILAVTFTNKAANEMRTRIEHLTGMNTKRLWMGTFHSLSVRILRSNIDKLPYEANFCIFDKDDQLRVVKSIVKNSRKKPRQIMHLIGRIKNGESPEGSEVEWIYKKYQEKLLSMNAMDFDDILINTVKLFDEFPDIRKFYADKFLYIHVDEYQDTNRIQYKLLKQLSSVHKNIFVVGDEDQSIYGFRGADIRNILDFEKDYKNARVIKLEQNYRSTANILKAASSVLEKNKLRKGKSLWTSKGPGEPITLYEAYNERDEANFVADVIEEQGTPFSRYLVLYRTNAQSRSFEEVLNRRGIPYVLIGGTKFYERKEIKDIVAYLKLVLNPKDDIAFIRAVSVPHRGIGIKTVQRLGRYSLKQNKSLFDAIPDFVKENAREKRLNHLLDFHNMIEELLSMRDSNTDPYTILDTLLSKIDYEDYLNRVYDSFEAEGRIENLKAFQGTVSEFVMSTDTPTLSSLMEVVTLRSEQDDMELGNSDRVTIMTAHNAKGLEYDFLFITGLEEGIFPHRSSLMSEYEMEEERRLFHVAMTRARKKIYITFCHDRFIRLGEYLKPSRFLREIPEDIIEPAGLLIANMKDRDSIIKPEYSEVTFSKGDNVYHKMFGRGRVLTVNGDKLRILFPDGIKVLSTKFAKLTRAE